MFYMSVSERKRGRELLVSTAGKPCFFREVSCSGCGCMGTNAGSLVVPALQAVHQARAGKSDNKMEDPRLGFKNIGSSTLCLIANMRLGVNRVFVEHSRPHFDDSARRLPICPKKVNAQDSYNCESYRLIHVNVIVYRPHQPTKQLTTSVP